MFKFLTFHPSSNSLRLTHASYCDDYRPRRRLHLNQCLFLLEYWQVLMCRVCCRYWFHRQPASHTSWWRWRSGCPWQNRCCRCWAPDCVHVKTHWDASVGSLRQSQEIDGRANIYSWIRVRTSTSEESCMTYSGINAISGMLMPGWGQHGHLTTRSLTVVPAWPLGSFPRPMCFVSFR